MKLFTGGSVLLAVAAIAACDARTVYVVADTEAGDGLAELEVAPDMPEAEELAPESEQADADPLADTAEPEQPDGTDDDNSRELDDEPEGPDEVVDAAPEAEPEPEALPEPESEPEADPEPELEPEADPEPVVQPPALDWVPSFYTTAPVEFARQETTVALFQRCVGAGVCNTANFVSGRIFCNMGQPGRERLPVNCVNILAARQFCAWVGGRLPTRDEWLAEATARGTRSWPWGDTPEWSPDCAHAVCGDCRGLTAPVEPCSRPAGNSGSGVCDMAGNVEEWTDTPGDPGFYTLGGSYSAYIYAEPYAGAVQAGFQTNANLGFRCVRDSN